MLDQLRQASHPSFKELFDNVHLLAVIIDADSKITYCNDYFLRLTGWTFEEVDGRVWHDVFVPPAVEDLRDLFAGLFQSMPSSWAHENDVVTRSGERRSVHWNNIALRDARDGVMGAAGLGEDITDRKRLERALSDCSARERGNLEKDLHDGLGQDLAGIALLARSLATTAAREHLLIADDLSRLSKIASDAIESCSKIARGFSPSSTVPACYAPTCRSSRAPSAAPALRCCAPTPGFHRAVRR